MTRKVPERSLMIFTQMVPQVSEVGKIYPLKHKFGVFDNFGPPTNSNRQEKPFDERMGKSQL